MTTSTIERMPATNASDWDSAVVKSDPSSALVSELPPAPLLENVVAAICMDARRDSLRYALRSNVGHDGE